MKKNKMFFLKMILIVLFFSISGCLTDSNDNIDDEGGGSGDGGGGGSTTGGSIIFDGTAEYLTLPSSWYTGDFTICLWMRPTSVTGQTLLSMSAADKYFYLSFDDNELDWKMESSDDTDMTIDATTTFTAGNLYQVCVTGDHGGTGSRAYVNGAQVGGISGAALGASVAGALTTLTIGYEPAPSFQSADGNKTASFNGSMDHFMIWSTVLPANAISQLYAGGVGFDPRVGFSNYTAFHVSQLQVYYLMGDDPLDVISGGSAIINDQQSNVDATPLNFETTDLGPALW